jgi:hypothetical protein
MKDLVDHPRLLFGVPLDTRLPGAGHDLCTFHMHTPTRSNHGSKSQSSASSSELGEFERAQSELVGKAVILTDGKA